MFGSPETTPGGRALKFYASVRLDIRRIGAIKDSTGRVMGNRTRVKVVKNKMAPPFTEAEFDILYAQGISWEGSVLDSALKLNLITKRGSWLSFDDVQIGQGSEAARHALQEDPELLQRMIDKINEHVAGEQ
jgi:recombination protein RecA